MSERATGEVGRNARRLIAATGTKKRAHDGLQVSGLQVSPNCRCPGGRIDLRPAALAPAACRRRRQARRDRMKRAAEWAFAIIGVIAISYLALYLYAAFTQPNFQPGDPIHIFRRPDAPNYSAYAATDNA